MKKWVFAVIIILLFMACKKKVEKTKPFKQNITESVYASGTIKAENQYQVYATVSGIINQIFVSEGSLVNINTPLVLIQNPNSKLNSENAQLAAGFNSYNANQSKLNDLKNNIDLAKAKFLTDSSLFMRQQNLWNVQVGSQNDLDQRALAFQNSQTTYLSAIIKYQDLKRQLQFASQQAEKNLSIAQNQMNDFMVKSQINGKVYSLLKEKGEIVNNQTPIAVIGSANDFKLALQIDEYDIIKVQLNQLVLVTLDSYKGLVYEARVSKINPLMNERTKTFIVEAKFSKKPKALYPNLTVEANIVIQTKKNVITLPRNMVTDDGYVTNAKGNKIAVKTGLKDYNIIEILSGVSVTDELIVPAK
jgi:multidrug efflux pump subunit AcrA (membrane-fusion protein)